MIAVTRQLSEFTACLQFDKLPAEVVERTRLLAMDHVGIALRARHAAALNESMAAALTKLGMGAGDASVIGDDRFEIVARRWRCRYRTFEHWSS